MKAKRKKLSYFWQRSEKHPISVFGIFLMKITWMTVKPVRRGNKERERKKKEKQ